MIKGEYRIVQASLEQGGHHEIPHIITHLTTALSIEAMAQHPSLIGLKNVNKLELNSSLAAVSTLPTYRLCLSKQTTSPSSKN